MEKLTDDAAVAIETKITAPITWSTHSKFKIQDLQDNQSEEVLALIKHHYFREEPMCKSIELLQDSASVDGYLDLIRTWMKDTTSLVAINTKSGRIIGALITRLNSFLYKTNTYSRVQIFNGETLELIMQLKSALVKQANVYESTGHDTYLRIYILCVHSSYKNKGIEIALLDACSRVASNMKISLLAGIFTSNYNQLIVKKMGYSLLTQIPYNNWIIDDDVIFDDPGIGNYSAAFMIMLKSENEKKSVKH